MSDSPPTDPTERDAAEVAERAEEAGVADEGAAYTDALSRDQPVPKSEEAEAHPS